MAVRKIDLDDDTEKALATVIAETGLTVSQVANIALKLYADDDEFACAVNEIQTENADYGNPPLLDGESEKILFEIRERTGASNLLAIKNGLKIYADEIEFYNPGKPRADKPSPGEVIRKMDLGPGGYAVAPATEAKTAVAEIIRKKHAREREA